MIMKCRCGGEIVVRTPEDIKDHWYDDGWEINDLISDYAELLFKLEQEKTK